MSTLIIIGIPLVSLILAILPFWYVRKKYKPNIKWRHLGAAFLAAVILLVGFTSLYFWIDELFFYKYSTLRDPFIQTTLYNWLTLSLLLIISPLFIYRLKYQERTKKGYLITGAFTLLAILLVFTLWVFILILGIAQFQKLG